MQVILLLLKEHLLFPSVVKEIFSCSFSCSLAVIVQKDGINAIQDFSQCFSSTASWLHLKTVAIGIVVPIMMVLSALILPSNQQKGILVGNEVEGIDVCHLLGKHVNMLLFRLPKSTSVCEFSASWSLLLEGWLWVNNWISLPASSIRWPTMQALFSWPSATVFRTVVVWGTGHLN